MVDVCIVGLGWLGKALYEELASRGKNVTGSRTSQKGVDSLVEEGMRAFRLVLNPEVEGERLEECLSAKVLVINIPPGRRDPDVELRHPQEISHLLNKALEFGVEQIIFVSSTSVFGSVKGSVDDDAVRRPDTASGRALLRCEDLLMKKTGGKACVVRFGGLYGPDRHPGRFFAGRKDVPSGDAPVNFIHREDAVGVIVHLIENQVHGAVLNACAPAHPPKKTFYHRAALHAGLTPPQFLSGGGDEKEVRCSWLQRQGYVFERAGLEM
ncbi:MAG: SDR family oxidoreductase [Cryomorphaceae bacterium]|nr:MAG: SDR family oxidoreductase [Cryomorphaceae bacterium]